MKASTTLLACLALLLIGGCCWEPAPSGHSSLKYPHDGQLDPRAREGGRGSNIPRNPWDRPRPDVPHQPPLERVPVPEVEVAPPEERPLVDPQELITVPAKPHYPYAIPVQGAPHLVVSPYAKDGPYINVYECRSGVQIVCPRTKKTILVP